MTRSELPLHALNHYPGGSDPIPGLETTNDDTNPDVDPTKILLIGNGLQLTEPATGTARVDSLSPSGEVVETLEDALTADSVSHWWRFREASYGIGPPITDRQTPDVVTNDSSYSLTFDITGGPGQIPINEQEPGPSSQSYSIERFEVAATDEYRMVMADGNIDIGTGESFTVEAWYRFNPGPLENWDLWNLVSAADEYLRLNADGSLTVGRDGTEFDTVTGLIREPAVSNRWYYMALVVDGTGPTLTLYVNPGADLASVIDETDPSASGAATLILSYGTPNSGGGATDGAFVGNIAEAAVYNTALSAERIRAHYVAGLYGDTGFVTTIAVSDIEPGLDGQHLVTAAGVPEWAFPLLDDNTDVNAAAPADGDVLTWDDGTSMWIPAAAAAADAWTTVTKAADEDVSSSTTVQADNHLTFTPVSAGLYEFELYVIYVSPVGGPSPDMRFTFGEDSSIRGSFLVNYLNASDVATNSAMRCVTSTFNTAGTDTSNRALIARGWYIGAGNATGFYWAQDSSSSDVTRVKAGSLLRYRRIL